MSGQQVAYRRVSSFDQKTARQLDGMSFDREFEEKASAKDANRPILKECLDYLRKGDILHVHSIDRLARNLLDLQQLVDGLTRRGVAVKFHKESLTFSGQGDHMSRLMLQMMGAFAEFERALIRERQREGLAAAKKAGKQIGRKAKLTPEQIKEIRTRASQGEEKKALAQEYGVSRQTIYASLAHRG